MMEDRDGRTEEAGTAQTPDGPAVAPAGAPAGNAVARTADHGGEGQSRKASTVGQRHDQAAASEEVEDDPFHDLLFGVRRSVRYHMRRQAFFDGVGEFLTLMALIAASTTVLVRVAWPDSVAVLVVASVSVLAQALALTWTPGRRARQHNEIARSFIDLEQKMVPERARRAELPRVPGSAAPDRGWRTPDRTHRGRDVPQRTGPGLWAGENVPSGCRGSRG